HFIIDGYNKMCKKTANFPMPITPAHCLFGIYPFGTCPPSCKGFRPVAAPVPGMDNIKLIFSKKASYFFNSENERTIRAIVGCGVYNMNRDSQIIYLIEKGTPIAGAGNLNFKFIFIQSFYKVINNLAAASGIKIGDGI